ncbi:MAG: hypothetical protein J0L51_09735 [Rhizobiales bacterium]|nr:hypothetical protein [Hyphomicrobiales bacterium]
MQVTRQHIIDIPLPVEEAFPLFTPLGEMRWIDEWQPVFIHPASGETEEGMVFRTGEGDEETIWSCIEWRPEIHHVRYARVTPASRFAHVSVRCAGTAPNRTNVMVRYEMTALTGHGREKLAALTEEAFRASIEGWKHMIQRRICAARS